MIMQNDITKMVQSMSYLSCLYDQMNHTTGVKAHLSPACLTQPVIVTWAKVQEVMSVQGFFWPRMGLWGNTYEVGGLGVFPHQILSV